ncbi:MAG: tRNA-specific adenosine deaminase [Planctomycetaceae bacterium]|nr:tRNA-specific adenosine deaminase [Planctomycetaceae bacterium]|tara:strand:+ start:2945 stop:3424 length:480 start_codon:yes stop_codon:yes gene_type:complete
MKDLDASTQKKHESFMRQAIALSGNAPGRPFGALIVDKDSGEVLSQGWNRSSVSPILHAEIDAISNLYISSKINPGTALALYSTAEPCPMCQAAIQWSGIETVVFGTSIEFLRRLGWDQINISSREINRQSDFHNCEIIGGVLQRACDNLFVTAMGLHI